MSFGVSGKPLESLRGCQGGSEVPGRSQGVPGRCRKKAGLTSKTHPTRRHGRLICVLRIYIYVYIYIYIYIYYLYIHCIQAKQQPKCSTLALRKLTCSPPKKGSDGLGSQGSGLPAI